MASDSAGMVEPHVGDVERAVDSFAVNPKLYGQLRRFCCGSAGGRSEREVNRIVHQYATGRRKNGTFRVTVEGRRLVGVAAFQAAAASHPDLGRYAGLPYIAVLALSERYRGCATPGRRLGDLLLEDALRAINSDWSGTPHVFVLVNPNNKPGRELFERGGFRMIVPARPDGGTDALFRRDGQRVHEGAID
jgi:ribosomal protein S18 acetylase RimI-like enzyme